MSLSEPSWASAVSEAKSGEQPLSMEELEEISSYSGVPVIQVAAIAKLVALKLMGQPIKTSASDDADDRQPPQANEAAPPTSAGALCSPTYDRQPFD